MALWLKQSTGVTISTGVALDKTDAVTEETGLSPTFNISKAGGVYSARNSAGAIAHDADGHYRIPIDATDTDTLGTFQWYYQDPTTHLAVIGDRMVLPGHVYDGLVSGSDKLQVDAVQINSSAAAAANLALAAIGIITGVAEGTPTTTSMPTDLTEVTVDHWVDSIVVWTTGVLAGQRAAVTSSAADGELGFSTRTDAASAGDLWFMV